jgi:transcriptional regulator with XRE-family HTH domain
MRFEHQGKLFQECRLKKGLSQRDVAEALPVHAQVVSNWERGICGVPKARLAKACQLFGVSKEQVIAAVMKDQEAVLREEFNSIWPSNKEVRA